MRTLTLALASRDEINRRFLHACEGEAQGSLLTFASPALLFSLLTASRWDMLKVLTGAGAIAIRTVAERLQRDMKTVQEDADALACVGILQRTADGKIEFPFDAVHVDFMLKAA